MRETALNMERLTSKIETARKGAVNTSPSLTNSIIRGNEMAEESLPKSYRKRNPYKFWRRISKRQGSGCWLWTGAKHLNGYGIVWWNGKRHYTHRVAFYLHHGYWPEPMCLHSCDNPPCCNPKHLREGTPADNMRDRDERGRSGWHRDYDGMRRKIALAKQSQSRSYRKFSDEQVDEIRRRYLVNAESARDLATEFNCHFSEIARIARYQYYNFRLDGTPFKRYEASSNVHALFGYKRLAKTDSGSQIDFLQEGFGVEING